VAARLPAIRLGLVDLRSDVSHKATWDRMGTVVDSRIISHAYGQTCPGVWHYGTPEAVADALTGPFRAADRGDRSGTARAPG
jgi:hypothetical protein